MLSRVALISGSTRGIGKNIALKLAKENYRVVITGKSEKDLKHVEEKIYALHGNRSKNADDIPVLSSQMDLRDETSIQDTVQKTVDTYGKIDVLVNNASAMWWFPVEKTDARRYDLVNGVNARGTYLLSRECIPHMPPHSHIVTHSPPIDPKAMDRYLNRDMIKNKVGYMVSKLGMSIVASGLAQELRDKQISSNCIWPKTAIGTAAMKDNPLIPAAMNQPKLWRTEDIIGDMVAELVQEPADFTNQFLIDETYLRSKGYTDFKKYRCDPEIEPPDLFQLFESHK